jgi:DNA-binding NarL/FixJ family response regulator
MTPIRILVADSQPKVRFALRVLLQRQPGLTVEDEAIDADELLAGMVTDCPDLVLLDWELPGLKAAGSLSILSELCPKTFLIVLSGRPETCGIALAAGADAFVSKADPPECLLAAIEKCTPKERPEVNRMSHDSQA